MGAFDLFINTKFSSMGIISYSYFVFIYSSEISSLIRKYCYFFLLKVKITYTYNNKTVACQSSHGYLILIDDHRCIFFIAYVCDLLNIYGFYQKKKF